METSSVTIPSELEVLSDKVGDFVAYWGFKKIHGKIWTHLFASTTPLDASELIRRLKISKALVSLTLKDLLHYQVVFEVGKSDRGTLLYRANQNIAGVIVNVLKNRERVLFNELRAAHASTCALPVQAQDMAKISQPQLQLLGTFIEQAGAALEQVIALNDLVLKPWQAFTPASNESLKDSP